MHPGATGGNNGGNLLPPFVSCPHAPYRHCQHETPSQAPGPCALFDGGGLYLEVAPPAGGKWWRLKYRIAGKEKRISLGHLPRGPRSRLPANGATKRASSWPQASTRQPTGRAKKRLAELEATNSFRHVALAWVAHQAPGWAPRTLDKVTASLEADVFPTMGAMPVGEVRARHVLAVVRQGRGPRRRRNRRPRAAAHQGCDALRRARGTDRDEPDA